MNAKSLETTFHFLIIFLQINIILFCYKKDAQAGFFKVLIFSLNIEKISNFWHNDGKQMRNIVFVLYIKIFDT